MPEWIKNALTETNNHTYDLVRILTVCSVLLFLILTAYDVVVVHRPFDMVNFGTGFGVLIAGVGAALALKPETKVNNV